MKQIALAFHAYNNTNNRLPPAAVCDCHGVPLLSWRVLLLPYLEHDGLYGQFKLDERWDSPHNLKLLDRMPATYSSPNLADIKSEPNTTFYQVFVGAGTPFEEGRLVRMPQDFHGGPSNIILFAEAGRAVLWTKPEDLPYDPEQPLPPLGGVFPGTAPFEALGSVRSKGFNVMLADASIRFLLPTINDRTLRQVIIRNNFSPLGSDW